jgi:hypothetical protein
MRGVVDHHQPGSGPSWSSARSSVADRVLWHRDVRRSLLKSPRSHTIGQLLRETPFLRFRRKHAARSGVMRAGAITLAGVNRPVVGDRSGRRRQPAGAGSALSLRKAATSS